MFRYFVSDTSPSLLYERKKPDVHVGVIVAFNLPLKCLSESTPDKIRNTKVSFIILIFHKDHT